MMNQEQTSSAVYGLFFADTDQDVLLGLYNLEGEAGAARAHYIALELEDFTNLSSEELKEEQYRLEQEVIVRKLALGQVPNFRFAA